MTDLRKQCEEEARKVAVNRWDRNVRQDDFVQMVADALERYAKKAEEAEAEINRQAFHRSNAENKSEDLTHRLEAAETETWALKSIVDDLQKKLEAAERERDNFSLAKDESLKARDERIEHLEQKLEAAEKERDALKQKVEWYEKGLKIDESVAPKQSGGAL